MKRSRPDDERGAEDAAAAIVSLAPPPPPEPGRVAVGKLPGRFARDANGAPMKWPSKPGYTRVNVCSSAKGKWQQFSPMLLGPVVLAEHVDAETAEEDMGMRHGVPLPPQALVFENFWQYSKVWSRDVRDPGNEHEIPSADYFQRRAAGWALAKGDRHARADPTNPKSTQCRKLCDLQGAGQQVTVYTYWFGEHLSYIEARRRIYAPVYETLVRRTEAWRELQARVAAGENVLLVGYDGYERGERSWDECFNDVTRPFGHEMVLGCMLDNQRPFPWEHRALVSA